MEIAAGIAITLAVAVAMEGVAWLEHRYIMHGLLWVWHEDHHKPIRKGLQLNDLFVLLFAVPSFLCIFLGLLNGIWWLPPIGYGMALYGLAYTLFHDIMFHRRIRGLNLRPRGRYWDGIINAHRLHHRVNTRDHAMSFGFLFAPKAYRDPATWPPKKE